MKAIVQLRGEVNIDGDIVDTLEMLNIGRVNHATFVPEEPTYEGMITKVNDYVAHGEPSQETVALLIRQRGEPASGDGDIDDEWVGENTDYDSVDDLASALLEEETTLQDAGLSPTLRLHPPRGGHDGIKQPVSTGGQIGVHDTDDLDSLLEAMR
ncbi:LSU ribosomal protein L30P [Halovenus aranensis]|jgi:large subunit ribosomal protein L30|uniref:Large ribosomal subunit protein uL30 n=1 Tax=Halovenus aranensis TaxID=890420 RepID=A0A1G8UDK9_9EURY|nr:50S ribosomal protein L30 [Halovenus aranensis]SDJ51811.1 LSU ribosomal protein L30P [Halovenus aranensis]